MSFFLYPGQGSQRPGMGRDFYDGSAIARACLDEAAGILGANFLHVLFDGSAEELKDTRNAQVALVAVGVAVTRYLEDRGVVIAGAAGHSVGEIAALVAVGALTFPAALGLTRERARLMAEEAPPGGMAAVLGLEPEKIAACLAPNVEIANFNGPAQTIVSGSVEGIQASTEALKAAGAKRVLPLPVSGAFHSSFMKAAAESFKVYLADVEFSSPKTRFVSSVSARAESEPDTIRRLLWQQLYSPVRWTETMAAVGPIAAVEAGPGNVLQGLARRMDRAPSIRTAGTLEEANGVS